MNPAKRKQVLIAAKQLEKQGAKVELPSGAYPCHGTCRGTLSDAPPPPPPPLRVMVHGLHR